MKTAHRPSCAIIDEIIYSLERPGQDRNGYGFGFPDDYSEALSDDDLQTLTTAGVSIERATAKEKHQQLRSGAEEICAGGESGRRIHVLIHTAYAPCGRERCGLPHNTDPRMKTPCKTRVKNPDNAP